MKSHAQIQRLTVTMEFDDGTTRTVALKSLPNQPLVADWNWQREPVRDYAAEAASGASWKIMRPGPVLQVDLRAVGAPVEDA